MGEDWNTNSQIRELKQAPSRVPGTYGAGFSSSRISLSLLSELGIKAQVLKGAPPAVTPRGAILVPPADLREAGVGFGGPR